MLARSARLLSRRPARGCEPSDSRPTWVCREPMRVARPLLVIELWPNSLTEYLGLQIWRAAGEDAARCQRAVAFPTTIHHQPEAGLLIPVNQLRFAWWVTQGGRNAFNRDWSCCCGWAFARNHGTD